MQLSDLGFGHKPTQQMHARSLAVSMIAEVAHKPLVCILVHSFVLPPALTSRHIPPLPFGHPEGQGSIAAARPVSVPAVSTSGAHTSYWF